MKQILHIFAKDVRRFWGEIFLSVAITAAFALFYPQQWVSPDNVHSVMGNHSTIGYQFVLAGYILRTLVPVSWGLLIIRAVHAETLVGDRQFWLTRPYEWPKLLAAKLLFLLAFIYVPIFIAQCAVLAETGFNPSVYIPGLLYNLLLLTIVVVLPLFAISVVTSTFAQMMLVLLEVFLGAFALQALVQRFMPKHFTGIEGTSYTAQGLLILMFCLCAVVTVLQYVRRRALPARILLFGIPALLILCAPLSARIEQQHSRIEANYPAASTPPVHLAYRPIDPGLSQIESYSDNGEVLIDTPLEGTGVASGTVLIPDAVKLEVEAPNGLRWASRWQHTAAPKFYVGADGSDAEVAMPRAIYEQFKAMPLTLRVTFALTQARVTSVSQIPLPRADFSVPGFGVCSPLTGFLTPFSQATGLICRSALRDPPLTYIHVVWSDTPCNLDNSNPDPGPGVQGAGWAGSLDRAPADMNISPVQQVNFNLTNGGTVGRDGHSRYLCPGSPVIFTQYERVGRTRAGITIQDYRLPSVTITNGKTHLATTTTSTTGTGQE
ncbi:MAG: hypothetical protein ABSE46_20565 [Terracidiphilus sp.]|jgi:hypothetical protein